MKQAISKINQAKRHQLIPIRNKEQKSKIAFSTSDGIEIFKIDDIIHCKAEGNYSLIQCRCGRTLLVSKSLKVVEKALSSDRFIRTHQSHLINIGDIQKINLDTVQLENNAFISVSRSKRSDLLNRMAEIVEMV